MGYSSSMLFIKEDKMPKNKPRWKDLPFEERITKQMIRAGANPESANRWKDRYVERHKKVEKR